MAEPDYTDDIDAALSVTAPNLWCVLHREPPREADATRAAAREELAALLLGARTALEEADRR